MEINQPAASPNYAPVNPAPVQPPVTSTKIPSVTAFAVGVILFLMPFVDIKCNGTSLQTISGVQLATGFQVKDAGSTNPFDDFKTGDNDRSTTRTSSKNKKDPNMYALIALGLGVLGLVLSITKARAAIGGAMVTGVASAASLIGLMIDVKKKVKLDMPSTGNKDKLSEGFDQIGDTMNNNLNITVDFTPWFYIAIIAFLAAAFFCYKRMKSVNPG